MSETATPAPPEQSSDAPNPAQIGNSNAGETPRIESRNPTVALLNKAHAQLNERKKLVEEELSRFDDLRKELETIKLQIESLEVTLGVFATDTARDSSQHPVTAATPKVPETSNGAETNERPDFTGNKREFVKQIVQSGGASGITPPEIDQIFSDRKIPRSKNLIYNALSNLVKQGSMRRKDGRYFSA